MENIDSRSFSSGSGSASLSKSISSGTSTSSSLGSRIKSFESGFFGVLLCLHQHGQSVSKVETNRLVAGLSIFIDFLNLLAFNLNPEKFDWGQSTRAFVQSLLDFTSLSVSNFINSFKLYLIPFWIIGSIISLSLVATFFVASAFRRNEFKYMLPLIHGLRFYVGQSSVLVILFVPFLNSLLVGVNCRYIGLDTPTLVSFPSERCWSPLVGAHTVLAAVFIASFICYAASFTSVYFDPSPISRELLARPHSKFEMVLLTSRTILAITGAVLSQHTSVLAIINFVCSSVNFASCLFFSCYFSKRLNLIRSGIFSAVWWSSCVLLAVVKADQSQNKDNFSITLLVGIIPFFGIGSFLSWLRLRKLDGSILFASQIEQTPVPQNLDAPVIPTLVNAELRYDHEYEIATRFILENNRIMDPRSRAVCCGVFEAGLRKFPSSVLLLMAYASFCQHILRDSSRAGALVAKAASSLPPFYIRFMIYARHKNQEGARQGDLDLVQIVAFQRSYKVARENHSRCVKSIRYLWKSLLPVRVDVRILPRVMERIYSSQTRAERSFAELLRKFKNSPRVLRSYACFLEDVKFEHSLAARYFEAAEEAEEEEAAKQAAKSKNASFGGAMQRVDSMNVPAVNMSTASILCLTLDSQKIVRKLEGGEQVIPCLAAAAALSSLGISFESLLLSTDRKIWQDLVVSAGKNPEVFQSGFISMHGPNNTSFGGWVSLLCNAEEGGWLVRLAVAPVTSNGTIIVLENDKIVAAESSLCEMIGKSEDQLLDDTVDSIIPAFSASQFARRRIPKAVITPASVSVSLENFGAEDVESSASSSSISSVSRRSSSMAAAIADSIADLEENATSACIARFASGNKVGALISAHLTVQKIQILCAEEGADEPTAHHALLLHAFFLQEPADASLINHASDRPAATGGGAASQQSLAMSSFLRKTLTSDIFDNGSSHRGRNNKSSANLSRSGSMRSSRSGSRRGRRSHYSDDFKQKLTLAQSLHRMMLTVLTCLLVLAVTAFAVSRSISDSLSESLEEASQAAILAAMSQRIPTRVRGQLMNAGVSLAEYQSDIATVRDLSNQFETMIFALYNTNQQYNNRNLYHTYYDRNIPIQVPIDSYGNTTLEYRTLWEITRLLPSSARIVADIPFTNASLILPTNNQFVFLIDNAIPIFNAFVTFIGAWMDTCVSLIAQSKTSESALLGICLILSFSIAIFIVQRALNKSHRQRVKCFERLISIPKDTIGRMLTIQYHIIEEEMAEAENADGEKQKLPPDANALGLRSNSVMSLRHDVNEHKIVATQISRGSSKHGSFARSPSSKGKAVVDDDNASTGQEHSEDEQAPAQNDEDEDEEAQGQQKNNENHAVAVDMEQQPPHPLLKQQQQRQQEAAVSDDQEDSSIDSQSLRRPSGRVLLGQKSSLRRSFGQVASSRRGKSFRVPKSRPARSAVTVIAPPSASPSPSPSPIRPPPAALLAITPSRPAGAQFAIAPRVFIENKSQNPEQVQAVVPDVSDKKQKPSSSSSKKSLPISSTSASSSASSKRQAAAASKKSRMLVSTAVDSDPSQTLEPSASTGMSGMLSRGFTAFSTALGRALGEDSTSSSNEDEAGKSKLRHRVINKKLASMLKTARMKALIKWGWFLIIAFCGLLALILGLKFYLLNQVEVLTHQESASGELYTRIANARFLARELVLNPTSAELRNQIRANMGQMRMIRDGLIYGDATLQLSGESDRIPEVASLLYSRGCKLDDQAACPSPTDNDYSLLTAGLDLVLSEYLKRLTFMLNTPVLTVQDPNYLFIFDSFFHLSDPVFSMLGVFKNHASTLIVEFELIHVLLFLACLLVIGLLYFSFTKRMMSVTTDERAQLQSLLLMIPEEEAIKLDWLDEFLALQ